MAPLTFARLRLYNVVVGLVQLVAGAAILALPSDEKSRLPWYSFFVASWSRDDGPVTDFYSPTPKKVANFPIYVWSGAFLLLSAADHLVVALPGVNRVYNRLLCRNRNPFRWAEYAVSASIMQVMIAQLCGVTDIHLLFAIAALMASTMLFGWNMEVLNGERLPTYEFSEDSKAAPSEIPAPLAGASGSLPFIVDKEAGTGAAAAQRVDWGPLLMGCWPFLAAVAVTACYFFQAVTNQDPPTFVWTLFFILTALYLLFAVNQWLQFKQVRGWRGFARAELWYMLLSLTSKQLLAWITYGGTKRFENEGQ